VKVNTGFIRDPEIWPKEREYDRKIETFLNLIFNLNFLEI